MTLYDVPTTCGIISSRGGKSLTPQTYDKKSPIWALGQEFLKADIRIPYMRAYLGVPKVVILDPRFLVEYFLIISSGCEIYSYYSY